MESKKKKNLIIIGILILVIALVGSTYAFFSYSRSSQAFTLTTNGITALFTEKTNQIDFTKAYPISDEYALENLNRLDYIDFSVSGNASNIEESVTYEVYLTEKDGNTLSSDYVKVYLTDDNDNYIAGPSVYSSLSNTSYSKDIATGKVIFKDTQSGEFTKNYRLYVWLDKDYSQNTVSENFSFYVNLYAYNDENRGGTYLLQKKIADLKKENPSCNYVVEDYNTNDELEATYLSGPATGDCAIDFNYVWWSGKMWRITAIYPDGAMKLVTDNMITSIAYNASNNAVYYNKTTGVKSYIFEWLNEDFLDTLYNNGRDVIDYTKQWNIAMTSNIQDKPISEELTMIDTSTSSVGLLNSYEYYKSYQNTDSVSGYLNVKYYWWLLNSFSSTNIYYINGNGVSGNYGTTSTCGIRPSIYLKPEVILTGEGTKNSPYRLKYDFESSHSNENVYTRHSGEYIKFQTDGVIDNYDDAPLYRIVSVEGNNDTRITKIVSMDYATYNDNDEIKNTKIFASTTEYGAANNTQSNDYWDYYLNNDWYNALSFKDKITSGIYYIGTVGDTGNYKLAVCNTANGDTISTCLSNVNKRVNTTFTGNVGLLRYGEMFATQQKGGHLLSVNMWLITKYSTVNIRTIGNYGVSASYNLSNTYAVRPTYYLKSSVKILSGSGTELDPFIVS